MDLADASPPGLLQLFALEALPARLGSLVEAMVKASATDLLVGTGTRPSLRVSGLLQPMAGEAPITAEESGGLVKGLLTEAQQTRRSTASASRPSWPISPPSRTAWCS